MVKTGAVSTAIPSKAEAVAADENVEDNDELTAAVVVVVGTAIEASITTLWSIPPPSARGTSLRGASLVEVTEMNTRLATTPA